MASESSLRKGVRHLVNACVGLALDDTVSLEDSMGETDSVIVWAAMGTLRPTNPRQMNPMRYIRESGQIKKV
jgi:hypothetical protein